ncbi:MAG: efflux RND transporter permease subunit [Desulfamplus sp.]|nr:efflux RND transporter permease subunit [Desulfamplus sp.]
MATMFILSLVVMGAICYPEIGVDLFPKVDYPIVNITTALKGASPEIMDTDITDKIEESVSSINGVKSISSASIEGNSTVTVEFVLERNIDLAAQDIREKVAGIISKLPEDISDPVIEKVDPDASPVLWLNLADNKSIRELSMYADEVLKEQIQKIEGVGAINIGGLRQRQIRIWLDSQKLVAYQIAASDVLNALKRQNIELPAGRIESRSMEYTIKVKGEITRVSEFNDIIIAYYNGAPIRIKDIGRAEDGMAEKRSLARFNGVPAVGMGIQKQSGSNTVEIIERIKKELPAIKDTLPPGMTINIAFDQSTFIKRSIEEVQFHLILGSLFAVLVVFIFLRNLRTTLITSVALPVSIISTFALIRVFDFTFNNMTMLALSLSVGLLIDDAIIVIENIYRHIEEGMSPREASSFATEEIGMAVMATTFAVVAIFLPVAFMKGIMGRFFLQFALTVVFAVMISMIVSFTLTPMMASIFLKDIATHKDSVTHKNRIGFLGAMFEGGYKIFENIYTILLKLSLRFRITVLLVALIIFVSSLYIAKQLGREFIPTEDQGQFIVRLEAPMGYSLEASDKLSQQVETIAMSLPEVKSVYYIGGFGRSGVNNSRMMITLKPKGERKKSQEQIKGEIRKKSKGIAGLKVTAEDVSLVGRGQRSVPIQYSIRGRDMENLKKYTRQIVAEFSKLPGIVDVDTSLQEGKPELKVIIDRDKAADLGVDVAGIAEAVNLLVSGEVDVTRFKDQSRGKRYDVRVRLNSEDRANPTDLGRIYVRSKDQKLVEISNIVKVIAGGGPSQINRVDRQKAVSVFANLDGKPLGKAVEELNAISDRVLTPDFSPKYKGMAETMSESFDSLMFALFLGIVMAYMVLAAQFESFSHPFIVLLSMPLSFIGAFGGLYLMGMTLNIFSFIGLILLMGLVKKNAILIVDYTNTLRAGGMSKRDALMKACPIRMRPILMTTLAMVFGMLPIAFGLGEGSETRAPMGIGVIGGLLTSLFLTLLVVPAAYDLLDEVKNWLTRKVY